MTTPHLTVAAPVACPVDDALLCWRPNCPMRASQPAQPSIQNETRLGRLLLSCRRLVSWMTWPILVTVGLWLFFQR